jgi:uncharacterized membrane protein
MLLARSAPIAPLSGGKAPLADGVLALSRGPLKVPHMTAITERLNSFERRLRSLEVELDDLRQIVAEEVQPASPEREPEKPGWAYFETPKLPPPPPSPKPKPALTLTEPRPERGSVREPAPRPAAPPPPPPPPAPPRELDLSFLFSARALAWTGGAVTLLGIVFFFVLSVQRGWIGPSLRVGLGAAASALVFGAGVWARRRYGDVYSTYAAVGAGIAGGYATLLAAAALYDLLPAPLALVLAGAIAGVGVATSVAWRSETIAGLGLIGAILVPLVALTQGGLSSLGTAFVAVVLAGTIAVALRQEWWTLLGAAAIASAPQIEVLMLDAQGRHGRAVALAVTFWLLYAAAGVAGHLRRRATALTAEPSAFLVFSGAFAGNACAILFDGRAQGLALLGVALAYAALAAVLFAKQRDLSALATAVALGIGGVAAADLLNGDALTVAWAAEASVLAWLARRVRELRFQLASLVWLGLAVAHTIAIDAPPRDLFVASDSPARGLIAVVAVAIAAALVALHTGEWDETDEQRGILRPLSRLLDDLRASQDGLRAVASWLAGALALYAGSLAILGIAEWTGDDVDTAFDWGHVGIAALLGLAGLACVRAGFRAAGLTILGGATVLVITYEPTFVAQTPRGYAFLAVALAAFLASFDEGIGEEIGVTLLAAGLILGGAGAAWLLDGTPLALVWSAEAAALAYVGHRTNRLHVSLGAFAWLGVAAVHALVVDAPPRDFVLPTAHPWQGIPALLALGAAGLAVAVLASERSVRLTSTVVACAAPLYAASLGLLEALPFDWGHVAVAGLWGGLGLAAVLAGRRTAGLALGAATVALTAEAVLELAPEPRSYALLVIAASTMLIGYFHGRVEISLAATILSIPIAAGGFVALLEGTEFGLAMLGVAAAHVALAAGAFRRDRDLSTVHWVTALVVAVPASAIVLDGTWLVLAWTAAAAGLALLPRALDEERFEPASFAYLALSAVWTLTLLARPDLLVRVHAHPGAGAPAALLVAAAAAVYASRATALRAHTWWASGTLAVYGVSLALLELFRHLGDASPTTAYQRGHTAVSALWGLIGLALLYAGLQRSVRALQLGGFALFGISLAKLFVFDLTMLSSVARAFSFLAVGAVLLLGGFFYQRLTQPPDTEHAVS